MFSLSLIEHLRLNGDLVEQNYAAHARAAERCAAIALKVKMTVLSMLGVATGTIVLSLFRAAREYQIIAAIVAAVAFALHAAAAAYGIEARVYSHRLIAHRLWQMCERYRGLLSEIQDGLVDTAEILARREVLTAQVHAIYEQAFPIDQQAYESLRQPPLESNRGTIAAAADQAVRNAG
jgi:conflict system pore-forming effector with SLATT domain